MATVNDSRLLQQPSQKDAADQNFDYMFKLLIIGNSSVGKTSFLFRYADDSFTSAFVSTVGIDFKVKTVFRNNKRIKLQIWVCLSKRVLIVSSKCYSKVSICIIYIMLQISVASVFPIEASKTLIDWFY